MACVENWTTVESQNEEDQLVLTITVPNACWHVSSLSGSLPSGVTINDLCNYEEGDLILTVHMIQESGCGSGSPAATVTVTASDYVMDGGGNYVQFIIYDDNANSARTIKRSRTEYEKLGGGS